MKRLILLSIASVFLIASQAQQLTLVSGSKSTFKIIIPEKATVIEIQAAKVFQDYIQRISGAILPIESDNTKPADNEVLIGNVNRPELKDVPVEKLDQDGIFIRNTAKNLIIAGGPKRGALYGVYTFLEKYLGCRKYSSTVTIVPKQKTITLNSINDMEVPGFTFREERYPADANDPEYMAWNKLDSHSGLPDSGNEWGSFGHTFNILLSNNEYGESHPEYFSFYDDKRHPGNSANGRVESQLCLSNPDVLEIVCKNLQSLIAQNPAAKYWSVKQNDNVNYCRCPECAALDAKYAAYTPGSIMYGTHVNAYYSPLGMGSLMTFINKVAERFPDKIISTFAYQYTRVPPKNIVLRKNVNIMLCSIESIRNVTFQEGDSTFCRDLLGWTKLTNNIIIWDYVVQFRNLISPFPNLHILQPNLQFLHKNGIPYVFEQGSPETGGEFHELKAYMIAKLLWNPDLDFNKTMDDFLSGYYGAGGKIIREYIDLLQNQMIKSGAKLLIFGGPAVREAVSQRETFLSDSLIAVYNKIFDRAEKAVAGSPEILERVQVARMPLSFAVLEIARDEKTGKRGAFIDAGNNKLIPKPEIVKTLYDFAYMCMKTKVSHVREARVTPLEYLDSYKKFLVENTSN